jgi:hypothetical protein
MGEIPKKKLAQKENTLTFREGKGLKLAKTMYFCDRIEFHPVFPFS